MVYLMILKVSASENNAKSYTNESKFYWEKGI